MSAVLSLAESELRNCQQTSRATEQVRKAGHTQTHKLCCQGASPQAMIGASKDTMPLTCSSNVFLAVSALRLVKVMKPLVSLDSCSMKSVTSSTRPT